MADNFARIKDALEYIDGHLGEPMSLETLSARFHFSPYYFHRMFSVIVGKTLAAHIRDRRLLRACLRLSASDETVLGIALDCGFNSAQSFSRAFSAAFGLPPNEYRRQGFVPAVIPVEEMIIKFTNRLKGGVLVNPKIIKMGALAVAGVSGDGRKTGDVWKSFEKLSSEKPLKTALSENGYEIRLYKDGISTVHVGFAVGGEIDPEYSLIKLPASKYASFEVYVASGYDSENAAMNEWLGTNADGYHERLLDGAHYCVEFYDERFSGNEAGSIVEIWIPIE